MSIHKLSAGSGYDYLTRQVAALDATERGHTGLASYYTAKGEAPGVWVGAGMAGIDGLNVGDVVTAEQMQALFGSGHHPLARERRAALPGDASDQEVRAVTRLGQPYKVYASHVTAFQREVTRRIAALNADAGLPRDWPVPLPDRARIRTEVATVFFHAEHGRDPMDARELAASIAKHTRARTTAVAGFDLTFSPVKSVSTLWAIAPPQVAARIENAHQAAIRDALAFLEEHALFTRTGSNGVRQVDVQGLVGTAFTHRDSRAGDPDLHTHVAVANKVQTLDGRWLSIDGRVLFKATVAASETYNTALERHLHTDLGLVFAERTTPEAGTRPVREVAGVDARLNARWSARRASIEARRGVLATQFQATHGRPPTPVEAIQLSQQATLETRDRKHEPRSLAEQRATWRAQAIEVLGSTTAIDAMIRAALTRTVLPHTIVDEAWVAATATRVVAAVEARRATWQTWHIRAEAQRQVRAAHVPGTEQEAAVDRVVESALSGSSVSLARPGDGLIEPPVLRRRDGASVYTVAGADLYTSTRVLAAERDLVAWAGRTDGYAAGLACVDVALLEAAANGTTLNAGQASLVRAMATSRARVQLAIAPAGAGKTTAMRVLAAAWTEASGQVLGLAPSAAAAAALREHTGARTDTLAKLVWSIEHGDLPDWAATVGPRTLVVIDEAGMADTICLHAVVEFVLARGGSVRLIGDDQQLAAIGAGGVLRDIDATHGAVRLTELMRFTDPAEGAASLALRDGQPEALGFYLDQGRVHVGDLAALTNDVFTAWRSDRVRGVDAIMLAPTRELVAELNARARAHRLTNQPDPPREGVEAGSEPSGIRAARLADGNDASTGDLVITRANDRRLRVTATDWVKNGDRWTVQAVHPDGGVTAQHVRNGHLVTLPADYVTASTELGYAVTVHGAQGVSVDVVHGLVTGLESRQQLYTMLTRGRHVNHVYVQVVGDGDPHTVIRPETITPQTATDLLEAILARDDVPTSATTLQRELADPAILLGQATSRYVDALYAAADDTLGPDLTAALTTHAEGLLSGITEEPAWPALRAHLLLLAASGTDPHVALRDAVAARELDTAGDRAAVLDWRLDDTGLRNAGPGPLPWLPGLPARLTAHPMWGQYLTARGELVEGLAEQVRATAVASAGMLAWVAPDGGRVEPGLAAEVTVWRAAMQVPDTDRRPTGPPQLAKAAARWQQRLDERLAAGRPDAIAEWGPALARLEPRLTRDRFTPVLAARLAALSRAGLDVPALLKDAMKAAVLPDDHAAAALWWRISRHVEPAVTTTASGSGTSEALSASWTDRLVAHVGPDRAGVIRASVYWPALVTTVEHALGRGIRIEDLLDTAGDDQAGIDVDECHAMVWRISLLTDPASPSSEHADDTIDGAGDAEPADLLVGVDPPPDAPTTSEWKQYLTGGPPDTAPPAFDRDETALTLAADLTIAGIIRDSMTVLGPSEPEITRMLERAHGADHCPVTVARMAEVNELTLGFYQEQYEHGWARDYLASRLGSDLAGHPGYRPGYAPTGWTRLVQHLRAHGVTDEEMTAAGVATIASTGRLIDRFRDRAVLPIIHDGQVLGFVGRRHPDLPDGLTVGPRYLNTADTPLFHKGAQLYGAIPHPRDAVPVLVEGPLDAIAVTLATGGSHVGLAPLGTALTQEQARQLLTHTATPVIATDGDRAGRMAAQQAFWLLAQHGADPLLARLPDSTDPAGVLASHGLEALNTVLQEASPLGAVMLDEQLQRSPRPGVEDLVMLIAAQPADTWDASVRRVADTTGTHPDAVRVALVAASRAWSEDPRRIAEQQLARLTRPRTQASPSRTLGERHTAWELAEAREIGEASAERLAARSRAAARHAAMTMPRSTGRPRGR